MKKLIICTVLFFASVPAVQYRCLAASFNDPTTHSATPPTAAERDPRYQLHPSDVIELSFPYAADFNQTDTVQPDGYLSLRGVGEIKVIGMTVPELKMAIRKSYSDVMIDPEFTITIKDFAKPTYTVAGEVKSGGSKELRGRVTVMQVLMGAGGFTDFAKNSQVILFRHLPNDWYEVKQLNTKKMLHTKDLSEDVYVKDGDIIYVPKTFLGKIDRYIPRYSLSSYVNPAAL